MLLQNWPVVIISRNVKKFLAQAVSFHFHFCVLTGCAVSVSIPVCKSLCQAVNDACRSVLEPRNLSMNCPDVFTVDLLLDCDEISGRTGTERFPLESITYSYNGNLYEFPCNDMIPSPDNGEFVSSIFSTFASWILSK